MCCRSRDRGREVWVVWVLLLDLAFLVLLLVVVLLLLLLSSF